MTATVHHLPVAVPTLEDLIRADARLDLLRRHLTWRHLLREDPTCRMYEVQERQTERELYALLLAEQAPDGAA